MPPSSATAPQFLLSHDSGLGAKGLPVQVSSSGLIREALTCRDDKLKALLRVEVWRARLRLQCSYVLFTSFTSPTLSWVH